jgi:hypothetical protein
LVYGLSTFVVASPDAASIATVSLIALGSATHSTNMNAVYTELAFTQGAGQLNVSAPADSDEVPPGYYLLFIVNSARVPSVGKIVKVGGAGTPPSCSGVVGSKLVLSKLSPPPGDDRLSLKGSVALPHPFNPPLNPHLTGVRLIISGSGGDVMDVTIPGGAYDTSSGVGWKATSNHWTYRNKTTAPPGGIAKLVLTDRSASTAGLIKVRATGRAGSYPVAPADLPLSWQIVLNPPAANCGRASFPGPAPAPSCAFNGAATAVTCK